MVTLRSLFSRRAPRSRTDTRPPNWKKFGRNVNAVSRQFTAEADLNTQNFNKQMGFYGRMQNSKDLPQHVKAIMQKRYPRMALAHAMLREGFPKREAINAMDLTANTAAKALAALPEFLANLGHAVHRAPLSQSVSHQPLEHVAGASQARSSPPASLKPSSPQRRSPPSLKHVSPVRSRRKNASPVSPGGRNRSPGGRNRSPGGA